MSPRIALAAAAALLLSGCSFSAQDIGLPERGVAGDTQRVEARFADALNLAVGAPVKLRGVTIGKVETVEPVDYTAKVVMTVQQSAHLHQAATARLRGTTPLGELYVDLEDAGGSDGGALLADGARIAETSTAPTIEDTMTTASLFLNGGGLAELGSIVREANRAIGGREDVAQDLLIRLDATTSELSASGDDIEATLKSLAGVSTTLRERQSAIHTALQEVGPAARSLRSHIDDLIVLLNTIEHLGHTTTNVVDAVHDNLVRGLREMGPIFDEMNSLEPELTPVIQKLARFAKLLDRAVPTAYLNTYLHFQLDGMSLQPPGTAAASAGPPMLVPQAPASGPQAATNKPGGLLPKVVVPKLPLSQVPAVPGVSGAGSAINGTINGAVGKVNGVLR